MGISFENRLRLSRSDCASHYQNVASALPAALHAPSPRAHADAHAKGRREMTGLFKTTLHPHVDDGLVAGLQQRARPIDAQVFQEAMRRSSCGFSESSGELRGTQAAKFRQHRLR